jgi:hypothetical protein
MSDYQSVSYQGNHESLSDTPAFAGQVRDAFWNVISQAIEADERDGVLGFWGHVDSIGTSYAYGPGYSRPFTFTASEALSNLENALNKWFSDGSPVEEPPGFTTDPFEGL